MEATTSIKPKTLVELLPGLSGLLSKDSIQTLTAKKQPPRKTNISGTAEKVVKPLTAAELRADILSLKVHSPRVFAQGCPSTKRKTWNSTVKVDKTVSRIANGQLKSNPVKKALNFQPKTNTLMNSRMTMASVNSRTAITSALQSTNETKFLKPVMTAKKKLFTHARTNIRISGISNISETPVINKNIKSRLTIANKENIPKRTTITMAPPKIIFQKNYTASVPDTPLSNQSWKSNSDSSFLQKEKEINYVEEHAKALTEEHTLENIAKVTPPVSTPFGQYRNVQEFFDHSNDIENNSADHDNTIMCFDNPSETHKIQREESVIVSLCDLLNKATVNNKTEVNTELKDLILIEKRTDHNIKMIDNSIAALNKIKESQIASLESVRRLIHEKQTSKEPEQPNKTLTPTKIEQNEDIVQQLDLKTSAEVSVIQTTKSPIYPIPKKNLGLRKKVFCKSMPNVSNIKDKTPVKSDMGEQALSKYLEMKEQMKFLRTPIAKQKAIEVSNTPAMRLHNLQQQLDKLYSEN